MKPTSTCLLAAIVALLAAAAQATGGPSAVAHAQDDAAARIDACVRSEMASRGIYGGGIAVARDGQIVFERAYGRKHRDMPDPVDLHTQFRIGSTTKALTAVAVMQQVDAGTIDLDAPITRYLQGFELAEPGQAERITVRDLLRHTSGLHDTSAFDESDLFGPTDAGALDRWIERQRGQAPYAPPGRIWNYSSANYMYAGRIVELVTGMSFQDYMDQRVFAPADMADTTMHAEQAVARGDFAYGHYSNPFSGRLEIYNLNEANNWARAPAGYANSTPGDLVRFASLLMAGGGDVVSQASVAEMQTRQQYRDLRVDQYYALGTFVEFYRGHEMVHHDGGAWGWTATLKWIPDAGLAVATVANSGSASLLQSTYCALDAYLVPRTSVPNPCRLNRGDWDAFVGTYDGSLNTGQPWTFHVTRPDPNGNLQLDIDREGAEPLDSALNQDCSLWQSDGPGSFNAAGIGTTITFIADSVEDGVMYLRNRFFVGRREASASPTATPQDGATPTSPPAPTATRTPTGLTLYLPWLAAADACMAQEMRDEGTPGVSLAIAVGGKQVCTAACGIN
jgi:CubicO group peptidase (beta-lactamase class C family)